MMMMINAHRHRAPYLPNGKVYEFQTWCTDGGRQSASATGAIDLQGQKSKVIPGPLMVTHIVRHIFPMARPTIFKLRIWMEDDDLHQTDAMTSKVKGQGRKVT